MMNNRRQAKGRAIDGILLLDKPIGLSSNAALQRIKKLFQASKAGHTGNLDPLATGMLPLCFGNATKVSAFLLDAEKTYQVRFKLGERTSTGDTEGEVVETMPVDGTVMAQLEPVLTQFTGVITQIPPMYSAIKHQGQRLYQLARQGVEVAREPRQVHIKRIEVLAHTQTEAELQLRCSKGTYVRTLVEDICAAMGSCGHVIALRRLEVGPYTMQDRMWTQEALETLALEGMDALATALLPIDSALQQWPSVQLARESAFHLRQGNPVLVPKVPIEGWVRVYGPQSEFLGMGEILIDGRVAPRRMMGVR
jgi:tRNA pseudouridine55 synthase